jgi:nucleotide-binding universal stress UspA family protein
MYKRILVPVDGSPTSIRGLDEAIELAKLTGGSLRLVHVLDQMVFSGEMTFTVDVFGILKEAGAQLLQGMKARVAAAGIDASVFMSEVLPGRVCDVVVEQAKESGADLIVVGTHGRRGVGRLLIGSDAEQIVRLATVPVLLVRSTPRRPAERDEAQAAARADPLAA